MAVWFEKLVCQGVLMVGEHDFTFLLHPRCLHQENTSHGEIDVKHFERYTYFQIAIPPAAWCLGFDVLWGSLYNPRMQSLPPNTRYVVTIFGSDQ